MNEIVRLVIDRVLSWPVSVFGICLIFQTPIRLLIAELTAFIGRASQLSVKHKNTTVEAMADANLQAKRTVGDSTEFYLGVGTAISAKKVSVSDNIAIERSAALDYGKGVATVQASEASIKTELERLGFSFDQQDTVDLLIRQLASLQCVSFFERTYRIIFGSQLAALDFLNTTGPVPMNLVEACFYDTARNLEQTFYSDFTFTQWLSFLLNNLLIAQENNIVGITTGGRDFLVWTVNAGLTHTKPP